MVAEKVRESSRAQKLILSFAGLVAVATVANLWLSSCATKRTVNIPKPEKKLPGDAEGDPVNWTEEQLRNWLQRRYVFPPSDANRDQLIDLVSAMSA